METFTAPQVCSLAGVTYRQIDYWCRTGLLRPTIPARGSGTQRRFDVREAQCAWTLGQLSQLGAALADIECLRDADTFGGWLLITNDGAQHVERVRDLTSGIVIDLDACPIEAETLLSVVAS